MTKTTTVPHLLEQLSVDLHANGVKFDTYTAHGIRVTIRVRFEPVSDRHDEQHCVVEEVKLMGYLTLMGPSGALDLDSQTDVLDLIPKSQVAAIEENLLAQMSA